MQLWSMERLPINNSSPSPIECMLLRRCVTSYVFLQYTNIILEPPFLSGQTNALGTVDDIRYLTFIDCLLAPQPFLLKDRLAKVVNGDVNEEVCIGDTGGDVQGLTPVVMCKA